MVTDVIKLHPLNIKEERNSNTTELQKDLKAEEASVSAKVRRA